jgi:TolB-like protein/Flp pilus assembly protein TadD
MFTDMVGFSAMAQEDEANALERLDQHNRILRETISKHGGREVKTVGDAFLVEFGSALDAARSALEIQEELRRHNESAPEHEKIRVRIGLHVGDVVQSGGDLFGDAVNIASRIEALADPGGIWLSQQVVDQVQNKLPNPIVRLPPVALKNIRLPITLYRLVPSEESETPARRVAGSPGGRTLAILPLANISPDPNDEYFADGLTEELISTLSQLPGLNVIARTSVVQYKAAPKPIAQVGQELGADTVLEGSVRKAGNRIRISLQLIDAVSQRHLWANTYNREVNDVFAVQSEIADRTADSLRPTLSAGVPAEARRKPAPDPAAYDAYLRGLVASNLDEGRGIEDAIRSFETATTLDPTFADAFAAWANFYVVIAGSYRPLREVMPRARELAARAVELDPESSEAHSALGNIALQFDHDWDRTEIEYGRAIALNPNNATALSFYGLFLISQERFDEAKEILRRAVRIDPRGTHHQVLAWAEIESGNFDHGLRLLEEERDRDPTSVQTHVGLGFSYVSAGRMTDARREADYPLRDATALVKFDHALLNALVGRPEEARAVLAQIDRGELPIYTSAADRAMMFAALGEKERALDLIEQDTREGDQVFWLFYRGPFFDPIRDDPRFVALLRKFRLPTRGVRGSPPHAD